MIDVYLVPMVEALQFALLVDSVPPLEGCTLGVPGQFLEEEVQVESFVVGEQTSKTGIFAETDSKSWRVVSTGHNTLLEAAEPDIAHHTVLR